MVVATASPANRTAMAIRRTGLSPCRIEDELQPDPQHGFLELLGERWKRAGGGDRAERGLIGVGVGCVFGRVGNSFSAGRSRAGARDGRVRSGSATASRDGGRSRDGRSRVGRSRGASRRGSSAGGGAGCGAGGSSTRGGIVTPLGVPTAAAARASK